MCFGIVEQCESARVVLLTSFLLADASLICQRTDQDAAVAIYEVGE